MQAQHAKVQVSHLGISSGRSASRVDSSWCRSSMLCSCTPLSHSGACIWRLEQVQRIPDQCKGSQGLVEPRCCSLRRLTPRTWGQPRTRPWSDRACAWAASSTCSTQRQPQPLELPLGEADSHTAADRLQLTTGSCMPGASLAAMRGDPGASRCLGAGCWLSVLWMLANLRCRRSTCGPTAGLRDLRRVGGLSGHPAFTSRAAVWLDRSVVAGFRGPRGSGGGCRIGSEMLQVALGLDWCVCMCLLWARLMLVTRRSVGAAMPSSSCMLSRDPACCAWCSTSAAGACNAQAWEAYECGDAEPEISS